MSEAKYHHRVPRAYMRSWCYNNNSIWTYNKNTDALEQRNINTILGENHYHSIRAGSVFQVPESLSYIFQPMEGFTVKYEDKVFTKAEEWNQYYFGFDEWEIHDSDGNILGRKKKNRLRNELESKNYNDIEERWAKQMESDWPAFISSLKTLLYRVSNNENIQLTDADTNKLMQFIVMFAWRNPNGNIFIKQIFDMYEEAVPEIFGMKLDEFEDDKRRNRYTNKDITVRDEFEHAIYLRAFYDYLHGSGDWMQKQLEMYIRGLTFDFILNDNNDFITSENIPFEYTLDSKLNEVIFPALPGLLVILCKKDPDKPGAYLINRANADEVYNYNRKIFEIGNLILSDSDNILKQYIS